MGDFKLKKTSEFEERGLNLLKSLGFEIEKNNETSHEIDYRILKDKKYRTKGYLYIDFQYSADFMGFGDLRVDIISAFNKKENDKRSFRDIQLDIRTEIKNINNFNIEDYKNVLNSHLDIQKFGKLFEPKLNSIVFFIFDKKESTINAKQDIPDIIAIIPRETLEKFILKKYKSIFNLIEFNNKQEVKDKHDSAFIGVKLSSLRAFEDFYIIYPKDIKELFKRYINKDTNKWS